MASLFRRLMASLRLSLLTISDLPHVQISQVLSLCYAIPTSLLLSQGSGLNCFLLILLPATVGLGKNQSGS
jgi:hypothetical protein